MTSIDVRATVPAPVAAPTPAPAEDPEPAAPADSGSADAPRTLTWPGQPQGWWSRNGATLGIAAGAGLAAGGVGALMLGQVGIRSRLPIAGVVAGALAIAGLAAAVTHAVRRASDEIPAPATGTAPHLPTAAAEVEPVHGGAQPRGLHVAHGAGSYWETVTVTRYRTNSDGHLESYQDTELERRYFNWNTSVDEQVGKRGGYDTLHDAIADVAAGAPVAIREQDGRYVAYDLQNRSHWRDLDSLRADDPDTVAIVAPHGKVWRREAYGSQLFRAEDTGRPSPTGIAGEDVGHHELRYRNDEDVRVGAVVTGAEGLESLPAALAELRARPGNQMVVERDGRYHVAYAVGGTDDYDIPNDGFVTTAHARDVVAIEQNGELWAPSGDWYVAPTTG